MDFWKTVRDLALKLFIQIEIVDVEALFNKQFGTFKVSSIDFVYFLWLRNKQTNFFNGIQADVDCVVHSIHLEIQVFQLLRNS